MIKNVVFDMGGVLIDFNLLKTMNKCFSEEYHEILTEKVFGGQFWRELDRGILKSADVIPTILPEIPEDTRQLVAEMISDFYPYMPVYEEMYDFVKRIKDAGYNVYLLSNATARFFDRYLDIPAISLMDGMFISCVYKLLKPEREIYEAFCNKFSLVPEECFFIDDMPQNIEGAKAYGMKGYVYKAPDYSGLEKALNAEGVVF